MIIPAKYIPTRMDIAGIAVGLAASSLIAYLARPGRRPVPGNVLPLIADFIDMDVAMDFLARLSRTTGPQTVLLHTQGGMVTGCAQIANALLSRSSETSVVVPLAAYSGGTLIALSADRLYMGETAALTAIDPVLGYQRSQHSAEMDDPLLKRSAEEYLTAMSGLLDRILVRRITGESARARSVLLGEGTPHGWPLTASELAGLGLTIRFADPRWLGILQRFSRG